MKMSIRTKMVLFILLTIFVVFVVMGIYHTIFRMRELKKRIVRDADLFVQLVNKEVGRSFELYFDNTFYKFRAIVFEHSRNNNDLTNIQIVNMEGSILYDMNKTEKASFPKTMMDISQDTFVLANLKTTEVMQKIDNDIIKIIAPYFDDYGLHKFSIVYFFSFARLHKQMKTVFGENIFISLLILVISLIGAIFISVRITAHIKTFFIAAKKFGEGNLEEKIIIKTNDEFEELANTFNSMAEEIRNNIKDLNTLIQELARRDEQKTVFLANLSHELRTPLTASLGYIDYLQKQKLGILNKDQLHCVEVVKRNLEKLNNEINSLLQVSKYILEGVKLQPQKFSFEEVIYAMLNNFKPQIEQKDLAIRLESQAKEIIADKDRLSTVLENLLANAIKFADPKTEIHITTHNYSEDSKTYFLFRITNQGVEIPEDKIQHIFEPFYQIDSGTSRKYRGVGLGLAIARQIIEAHSGKIDVMSVNGLVTFEFIIPQGGIV